MSRTTTFDVGERWFWAWDDALAVWLAYVVEEIERSAPLEPWLRGLAEKWRQVNVLLHVYGTDAGELTNDQAERLEMIAVAARQRAVAAGDIPVERLRQWIIVDDLPVSNGYSRTGDCVDLARVLEVADGFIALVAGRFPPDPPAGKWLLGTGEGYLVV